MAAGSETSYARLDDGTVWAWGRGYDGQLGIGLTSGFQPTPVAIKLAGVDDYWPDGLFTFARTKDGALWFWGERDVAKLLVDAPRNQSIPARVPAERYLPPSQ